MAKVSQERKLECKRILTELLPPGTTLFVIIRHVSASGMMRKMSFFVPTTDANGEFWFRPITTYVADTLGYKSKDYHGDWVIDVSGTGMDMVFHVAYELGSALHADGYSLRKVSL